MHRRFLMAAAATILTGAFAHAADRSAPRNTSQSRDGVMHFRQASVMDHPDMIGGQVCTYLVPATWRDESQVIWRMHPTMPAGLRIRVTNPDGPEMMEYFPTTAFSWGGYLGPGTMFPPGSNYMGNEVRQPPRDAGSFITQLLLPVVRPGLRYQVVGQENLPELARTLMAQSPRDPNVQMHVSAQRVRIAYDNDGQAVEEDFYAAIAYHVMPAANNMTIWVADRMYSMRAARGELDEQDRLLQTMLSSTRLNMAWFNRYAQLCQAMTQMAFDRIRAAGEMSRIISRTNDEISQIVRQTYETRQASEDRVNRHFAEYIRGVDTYNDPNSDHPIELPAGYDQAWVNGRGEYVLSDNPNFNPNVEMNGDWTRMRRQN